MREQNDLVYCVYMHELGHAATVSWNFGSSNFLCDIVYRERLAWQWARAHLMVWTPIMQDWHDLCMEGYMDPYVPGDYYPWGWDAVHPSKLQSAQHQRANFLEAAATLQAMMTEDQEAHMLNFLRRIQNINDQYAAQEAQ
jgi:hypothetical protein